jgi:hypothetical protein
MVNNFSPESFPKIPPAVNEFVAKLSEGSLTDQVYSFNSVDNVTEFILNFTSGFENINQKQAEAIGMITKPYLEKEGKVNIGIINHTIYAYDSEGIAISFVKPHKLGEQLLQGLPLIALDGVHAGTSIPNPVRDLINPKILTNKPIYQANPSTAVRQSDVGVQEFIGKLWRGNQPQGQVVPVIGSAFFWNLIICNGNRPIPSEEETTPEYLQSRKIDCWLTTQTYRGDFIYRDNQLPNQEIRNQIQQGHSFGVKVAAAVRCSLYFLSQVQPIIIEPHSYSGFSHPFLNKYLHQRHYTDDWIQLAKQEGSLRPLVSVLDVQKQEEEEKGYWTTTLEESKIFYQAFLAELKSNKDKLPPIDNIPESRNDVYGYGGGILKRLEQVGEQASQYAGIDDYLLKNFYQHNILTVEINRLLIQLSEFEHVSSVSQETYNERCQIVGGALIAGIQALLPLMTRRLIYR